MAAMRVGVVGVGNISGVYLRNLADAPETEIVALADLDLDRAKAKARDAGVPLALTPDALLEHPDVELVLNLTVPQAHIDVARRAVANGKHVYSEKPLGVDRVGAAELLAEADARGLRVGCAPDTFLGAGLQTALRVITEGRIGEPIAAEGSMLCHGHESWHPSPEFYYQKGGGPLLDMGPYYLTSLIALLGGLRRVTGSAQASFPTRTITSEPKAGTVIDVETPTHLSAVLDFESGAIGTLTTSFDVWHGTNKALVVHGTEGSMTVPDPNGFGGEVRVRGKHDADWAVVPHRHGRGGNDRGVGVVDLVRAVREGRPHRASGALAFHVLDAMLAVEESSVSGRHVELSTRAARPEPLPEIF